MAYDCWRGMVGIINPTKGSGSLVELFKMLPDGIGVIPLFNNVRHGKLEEFRSAIPAYEEKIAELAGDQSQLLIQQYLNQLQDLRKISATGRESVVCEAFKDLLKGWACSRDLNFVSGISSEAQEYRLGNRSAVEWILDQYKEKKPRDPTIREKLNTRHFADYKEKVIDLLMRVTTVSMRPVIITGATRGIPRSELASLQMAQSKYILPSGSPSPATVDDRPGAPNLVDAIVPR